MGRRRKKEQLAHYSNAILYTDWVIAEIIKAYSADDALIIYLSDHAQALYDWPQTPEIIGHSFSPPGLRIPLFFHATERFRASHPAIWDTIRLARHRMVRCDLLAQSLLQLLGVDIEGYCSPEENFFCSAYTMKKGFRIRDLQYSSPDTINAPAWNKEWLQREMQQ